MGLVFLGVVLFALSFVLPKAFAESRRNVGGAAMLARFVAILMVVGGMLGTAVTIVPTGHRGVLLRFGAVQGVLGEGIHLIVPQVNTVELIEVRTQKEEAQSQAASKDLQTVSTNVAINYHVDEDGVDDLFQKVGNEYRKRIIDPITQESLKAVTARYTAEELIRLREKVKMEVQNDITNRLRPYNIVVEPNGVSITNFAFSEEFNKAIEQKQVAQQTAEKQRYVLQQAKLQAETAVSEAKGKAEAARINAQALQAQGGSRVLAREWIEKWDGKLPTVNGGTGSTIIDIRELMREGQSSAQGQ
ncbi:MAG TPA: prohibitin family protein [Armatimonadaceae bacterium]|nr:prohibitin family protein [Armatimonadaceae bacterium]